MERTMLDVSPEFLTIEATAPTMDDLYMTPREVADRWRIDEGTLANWRTAGEGVPWVKVGGSVRYKVADVIAFETENTRGYSRARLAAALRSFPGLTSAQRERLLVHITEVLKG
jgi:hypothetical protein